MNGLKAATEWLDDNTLIFMKYIAGTGTVWTKLNTKTMTIISEGAVDLGVEGALKYAASGYARSRNNDNTLFYFSSKYDDASLKSSLVVAAFNSSDMSLKNVSEATHVQGLAYESFGDSFEDKAYVDSNGDIYISCLERDSKTEMGVYVTNIARVKSGEFTADASYLGKPDADSDILIAKYLKPGKAILYIRDANQSSSVGNTGSSFNSYYAVYDNATKTITPMPFEGKDLPWSSGRFANRICTIGDKVYFGLNTEFGEDFGSEEEPVSYIQAQVYIYNTTTDEVTKGFGIDAKYEFFRMHAVEN